MKRPANHARTGFTLVEILVVIAIIAILAGLITGAAMVVYSRAIDAGNANDITQLRAALEAFKTRFKVYPPSKVRLLNSMATSSNPPAAGVPYYDLTMKSNALGVQVPNTPLDYESWNIINRIWSRLSPSASLDWSGGTSSAGINGDWTLEGDQCLVFFLGGIPTANPPGAIGFSTSPSNPTAPPTQGATRDGPFYTSFQANRLVIMPGRTVGAGLQNCFYSYADAYASIQAATGSSPQTISIGKPFAYFATLKQPNQYNPYYFFPYGNLYAGTPPIYTDFYTSNAILPTTPQQKIAGDCDSIGAFPYMMPSIPLPGATTAAFQPQFQNANLYQIISAGPDLQFGSVASGTGAGGTIWNPASGGVMFSIFSPTSSGSALPTNYTNASGKTIVYPGNDDRTNFCPNILSAGNAQ